MDIYIHLLYTDAAYEHAERRVVPISWKIFAVVK